MIVPHQHDQERHGPEQDPHQLLCIEREPRPALIVRHTVDRKDSDAEDEKDQAEKPHVEIIKPAAVHDSIDHSAPAPGVRVDAGPSAPPAGAVDVSFM